jgi:hypothetical protein
MAIPATTDELMFAHRAAWAAMVLGDDAVDLTDAEDPVAALEGADAAMWLDGYTPAARDALVDAAERGVRLIIAVPAHTTDATDLIRAIQGATILPQVPAGGSLIGDAGTSTVEIGEPARNEHAAWLLVSANAETAEAHARLGVAVGTALAAHIARLEDALEALQEANVRLARDRLGRHDAAAGSIIHRAAYWRERFEFEQELAQRHHDWYVAAEEKLDQPQYRAADRIYHGRLRMVPGLRALIRRLGRA